MKTTIILAAALIGALAASAAMADGTLGGCALTDKGGYSVKTDATCVYSFAGGDAGQETDLGDYDSDPSTPNTRG